MRSQHLALASLFAVLGALPSFAQSVEEQLQRGIYDQQTAGDVDSAIRVFRQIIASNPTRKLYAAQAQLHLAQAFLQKGDLEGAAREFSTLAASYSEFRDVIAEMSGPMVIVAQGKNLFTKGTVEGSESRRYVHTITGVQLTAPAGWRIWGDSDSSGGGEMVHFSSSTFEADPLVVWLKKAKSGADIPGQLRNDLALKANDRTSFTGWTVRPESVQMRAIAGREALSAVADYTEDADSLMRGFGPGKVVSVESTKQPVPMVEYMTWVRSPSTHAFFFGRAKVADLAALKAGLDELASTAIIP